MIKPTGNAAVIRFLATGPISVPIHLLVSGEFALEQPLVFGIDRDCVSANDRI